MILDLHIKTSSKLGEKLSRSTITFLYLSFLLHNSAVGVELWWRYWLYLILNLFMLFCIIVSLIKILNYDECDMLIKTKVADIMSISWHTITRPSYNSWFSRCCGFTEWEYNNPADERRLKVYTFLFMYRVFQKKQCT